jgi:16S rRNA (uracil1498-N3)-methyltransferase
VRRIRVRERIDIGDGAGLVAGCEVLGVAKDRLELRVESVRQVPQPAVRFALVQALAKGGRDELAVETATEIGVDAVVPWQADRSIVRWDGERGDKARRRWQTIAREAAKQARRPWVPEVEPLVTSAQLGERLTACDVALVLHESADRAAMDVLLPASGSVAVVVGPEGGITDDEIAQFTRAGAHAVRLGPEVLRASTAGPVALAYLASQLGRWAVLAPDGSAASV